jgi:hypothetical protein
MPVFTSRTRIRLLQFFSVLSAWKSSLRNVTAAGGNLRNKSGQGDFLYVIIWGPSPEQAGSLPLLG